MALSVSFLLRCLILLLALFLGWKETSPPLLAREICSMVTEGGRSQVQSPLLHPLPEDYTISSQLVHQHCVASHWGSFVSILDRNILWSCSPQLHLHPGGDYLAADDQHHGPHQCRDCVAPGGVCSPQHPPRPPQE